MSEIHEGLAKLLAIGIALGAFWLSRHPFFADSEPRRRRLLWALTALGAVSYVNFGAFHTDGRPLHVWDQFHYVVGSKYWIKDG